MGTTTSATPKFTRKAARPKQPRTSKLSSSSSSSTTKKQTTATDPIRRRSKEKTIPERSTLQAMPLNTLPIMKKKKKKKRLNGSVMSTSGSNSSSSISSNEPMQTSNSDTGSPINFPVGSPNATHPQFVSSFSEDNRTADNKVSVPPPNNSRKTHKCLYVGCNKVYGKSSHLKAHLRYVQNIIYSHGCCCHFRANTSNLSFALPVSGPTRARSRSHAHGRIVERRAANDLLDRTNWLATLEHTQVVYIVITGSLLVTRSACDIYIQIPAFISEIKCFY